MKAKEWKISVCLTMMIINNEHDTKIHKLDTSSLSLKKKQGSVLIYYFYRELELGLSFNKIHFYLNEG